MSKLAALLTALVVVAFGFAFARGLGAKPQAARLAARAPRRRARRS